MSGHVRLTLADLSDGSTVETEVTLRGKSVKVRDLSLHERNLLLRFHGEADEQASAGEKAAHQREKIALLAAVALGYGPDMGVGLPRMTLAAADKEGQVATWVKNTLQEVQSVFKAEELSAVLNALNALSTAGSAGNSSAPGTTAQD